MLELKKQTAALVAAALDTLTTAEHPTADEIATMMEYPPNPELGDLAFPCFKLAKTLRRAPAQIAADIAAAIGADAGVTCAVAGGYLNFSVDRNAFTQETVARILAEGDRYGSTDTGAGKTVVLDYSSPNVAKPFHIGHLGTTVIGHALKNLHAFAGYHCIGINHLGDWGTQFGKMIYAYRNWGSKAEVEAGGVDALVALYVKFHAEAEADPALADAARAEFTKLEHGDAENLALWKWFIDISLAEYEKTYKQLGITFDSYAGESFYTDKMPAEVAKLREKQLLTLDDGASIVDLSAWNMPPCLILKKDGSTLYPTRDIAAAVYRHETYNFDKVIYVTSGGQSLHFAQWFKVVELMGYDWYDKLVHVPYGTISVEGVKLSTRAGNVILLRNLFAEAIEKAAGIIEEKNPNLPDKEATAEAIGVGAIVFHYLMNSRVKDISFVLADALSFEGNTGPYAQYTHARTCSILAKAGDWQSLPIGEVTEAAEYELASTLSRFAEKVQIAIRDYEPSVITHYILDVCAAFNRFYHECQILTAETDAVRGLRLALTAACHQTLKNALGLICIKAPERI